MTEPTLFQNDALRVNNLYSDVMFTPSAMRAVIARLARVLPQLQAEHDFDTIVVTGKSGNAVGFALSMVTGIRVVHVRKGESSHGDMIEGPNGHKLTRYAFFDDCIASGATLRRVKKELANFAQCRGCAEPQHVLNILYQGYENGLRSNHAGPPTYYVDWHHAVAHEAANHLLLAA